MSCANKILLAALLLSSALITAAQKNPVTFEVASVKANKTVGGSSFGGCYRAGAVVAVVPKGRCIFRKESLRHVIAEAYNIPIFRVDELMQGGPNWISTDEYDIEGKAENDSATESELQVMMQALLAERFKLSVHEITKESAGYALVVAKNGPKLKPTDGSARPSMGINPGRLSAFNSTMTNLARGLSNSLHQPVVDKTGMDGKYDFELTFGADDQSGPSIFTAIQEELGLKLESQKVQTRILVIDHAERPSEN